MGNNIENLEEIESLDDTMVFALDESSDKKEVNVIREKNKVVDFTSPVKVLSDVEKKDNKKAEKKTSKKQKNGKKKFKPINKVITWWKGLTKAKKIISIIILVLVLILLVLGLLLIFKKDNKSEEKKPDVVLVEDNYRYENGVLTFLDAEKKEIGKYTCKNKDEKKCYVAFQSNEDDFSGDIYVDEDGNKLTLRSAIVNNNYVFIVDNKKGNNDDIILYSISSKSNIDEYTLVKQSTKNKNMVVLKTKDNKYGVLNLSDVEPATAIAFSNNYAGLINTEMANKYASVKKMDKYYLSDFTDQIVSPGFSNPIVDYNDNYIVTKSVDGEYKVFDFDGNDLHPKSKFIFIKLIDKYYAALSDSGIIVYDNEGLKYNEIPIGLSTTNYNKVYTFDANNQVINTEVAFELEQNDDYVTITRGKAVDALSIKEAKANKDQPYINYFNGILYIYSDVEKDELLGKYTCRNKNTSGQLDHCNISTSNQISNNDMTYDVPTGVIPILNKRYAFIKDTLTTGGIYLYDLSQNKKLGPYSDVEAIDSISAAISHKDMNGTYFIVKNNKNLFGLLKVNQNSVDILLNFDLRELEHIGDYYVGRKSSDTYVLFNNAGKEVTKDVGGKIMSYNSEYFTVKTNNNYNVHNYNGEKISSGDYSYIKLYDTFYVGITNNSYLGAYKYNKVSKTAPDTNVLTENVNIKASDSWKKNPGFTASKEGSLIKVTVGDKSYYEKQDIQPQLESNTNNQNDN